jgi:RNase P/RNase MRP subunit POP5
VDRFQIPYQVFIKIFNRRNKRRYLVILHSGQNCGSEIINLIKKRNSELFGHIATEKSDIRLIRSEETNIVIISCKLECLDNTLSSITFSYPPLTTLDMSGTLKRLRKRLSKRSQLTKVNTPDSTTFFSGDDVIKFRRSRLS